MIYKIEGVDFRFFWKIDIKAEGPIFGKYRQKKSCFRKNNKNFNSPIFA